MNVYQKCVATVAKLKVLSSGSIIDFDVYIMINWLYSISYNNYIVEIFYGAI